MEMPIELIVTLMIVLVVGALIVTFSQTILGNAENQLPKLDASKTQETQILEVATITNSQIAMLVDECFKNRFGKVFKQETCFIVHSDTAYKIGSVDDINALTSDKSALGRVDVGEMVNTVLIIWDFANTNVEVSA
jgi:hypothetical protein